MPIYFTPDADTRYPVDDLPVERWITIQRVTGRQWHECLGREMVADLVVAKAVLDECAAETGKPLPERLTLSTLLDLLRFDLGETTPTAYTDGMPDPKASGTDPATT